MPFDTAEAIAFVQDVAQNEQIRVTVREAVKAGIGVGCAAAAGGILFGPIGIAVAAGIAGVGAAIATRDKFLPLPVVIANMSNRERGQLVARVEHIAQNLNVTDLATLSLLVAGNNHIRGQVVRELVQFITEEIQVSIGN